jgi:hypothetical protein
MTCLCDLMCAYIYMCVCTHNLLSMYIYICVTLCEYIAVSRHIYIYILMFSGVYVHTCVTLYNMHRYNHPEVFGISEMSRPPRSLDRLNNFPESGSIVDVCLRFVFWV